MEPTNVLDDPERLLHLFRSVIVSANDAVLITEAGPLDAPGPRIIYVNPAFSKMTGYSLEEVLGKSPRLLQGPLSGREAPAKIRAALLAWQSIEIELINYRKDGSVFWVELSISPVADDLGWYTHWISVQREITDRKIQAEAVAQLLLVSLQNDALTAEIRERRLVESKLSFMAFHDGLTGLRNRAYFMDTVRASLEKTKLHPGYTPVVLYLDLDDFKGINDTLGHRVGDFLLTEVARRLTSCVRPMDTLARMSGDEFTVLLEDPESRGDAQRIADNMLEVVKIPLVVEGTVLQLAVSVGMCEVVGSYTEAEDILRDADLAMYSAKRSGGGRSLFYEKLMYKAAMEILQTKLELRVALERGEFELFYQPFIDHRESRIDGMEA